MTKTKLILCVLVLLMSATQLMATPTVTSECCKPQPVGGMQTLEENTLYPLVAQKEGLESNVSLVFSIDTQGNVSNIRVAQSGGMIFDASAISAVRSTEWSPAMQDGRAVAVQFELPFEYRTQ